MAPPLVAGVLMAGGQSRRMGGGDKCLRDLAGTPILGHILERARPQVAALVLNANGDPGRFAAFGQPVVADSVADFAGPLGRRLERPGVGGGGPAGLPLARQLRLRCAFPAARPGPASL